MENKQNQKTVLRCPRDVYKRIVELAEKEDRSINGEIVALLRSALEAAESRG